ncbi:MAG: mevalonate kinase [Archangium sp.]|nr:mevalonate kinase [Archangium sp.]
MSQSSSAFGPGKVIVLGEHGAVYGEPALAAPIARGVRVEVAPAKQLSFVTPKGLATAQREVLQRAFATAGQLVGNPPVRVSFTSTLPLSVGLGSSGALSVALARALLPLKKRVVTSAQVEDFALQLERAFHGTPSGVDHTTSARGSMLLYARGKARVVTASKPIKVVVAIVGARASTKTTVSALRERQARWPERYRRVFKAIGQLARDGAAAATAGDLDALGDAMNMNQGFLAAMGLSSARLEAMVYRLREAGALGAKLTGAGGDGGAVIGLFLEPEPVVMKLRKEGIECFASQLAGPVTL